MVAWYFLTGAFSFSPVKQLSCEINIASNNLCLLFEKQDKVSKNCTTHFDPWVHDNGLISNGLNIIGSKESHWLWIYVNSTLFLCISELLSCPTFFSSIYHCFCTMRFSIILLISLADQWKIVLLISLHQKQSMTSNLIKTILNDQRVPYLLNQLFISKTCQMNIMNERYERFQDYHTQVYSLYF